MAGLKSVFCESIKKGWGVGWGMGGFFFFLSWGLGLVSKINLVDGEYKEYI